jgi:hypothetical protein
MLYGTNSTAFQAMQAVIPGTTACRIYVEEAQGIPTQFPDDNPPTFTCVPIVSFQPNVQQLLSGQLDSELETYMKAAKPGAWLTAYHEANIPANPFIKNGGTAEEFVAMQAYLRDLARQANSGLLIGQILGCSATPDQAWVCPGLDFYGLDGYARLSGDTAMTIFDTWIGTIRAVQPDAPLAITENNAGQVSSADQILWFEETFGVALNHCMLAFLTWWGSSPTAKPPSFSPTGPYVPALTEIAACAVSS